MNTNRNVVLITGASSGIGKATAELLIEKGYVVYAAARRVDKMASLEEMGGHALAMDVTDDQSMIEALEQIKQAHGGVDILVNNAGYGSYGAVEDVELAEAKRQFEVNVFGLARLTQLVLPHMRENRWGKVLNITSMGGKIYTPMGGWYHATKFAVEVLSDSMRFETKPFGIDVIIIEPGAIKTEWSDIAMDGLFETSGDTAYSEMAQKLATMIKSTYENPKASDPIVIAKVILKAITAKKPKTRYVAGHLAKPFLFLRWLLTDKMYDRLLAMNMK